MRSLFPVSAARPPGTEPGEAPDRIRAPEAAPVPDPTGPPPSEDRGPSAFGRWRAATFSSLASDNYRRLFQGSAVTQVGMWMQQVVFGWLVLELTDSPFYLGLTGFFRALPMLVISPFGGVLADRVDRRKLLLFSQVAMMGGSALLAFLVASNLVRPWHLLVTSFLMGTAMSMNMPARQALVSQLVSKEQLPSAIALNSMSMNSSRIVGPALAGVLIGVIGTAGCIFLQALGYVWSIFNVLAIEVPAKASRARAGSWLSNLTEGFRYCYEQKTVFAMLSLAALTTVFGMPYMQLLPAFARDTLGIGAGGLGMMMTAVGAGALTGSIAVASLGNSKRRGTIQLTAAGTLGLTLCLLSLSRATPLAMFLLAAVGASSAVLMALNQTIIQQVVPDHLRGRVLSVYMVTWGLMPLGTLPAGLIAEHYGTPMSIFLGGLICYVGALWVFFFRPGFRQI